MLMLETIKVSSRGQIVIPEKVRKDFNIEEGTKLILVEQGTKLILETEQNFTKHLKEAEEKRDWLKLAEQSMIKLWDNEKDESIWGRYV